MRMPTIEKRIDALDWNDFGKSLTARGYAVTPQILTPDECAAMVALYRDGTLFRSHIIMERHRFGMGDYKYFSHPLPEAVTALRTSTYTHLAKIANEWAMAFGESRACYPTDHAVFLRICHK